MYDVLLDEKLRKSKCLIWPLDKLSNAGKLSIILAILTEKWNLRMDAAEIHSMEPSMTTAKKAWHSLYSYSML